MATSPNLRALLDQSGWIHALARRLVADPHLADDLVQETWVDALERRPDERRPLRGWLATVARNNLAKLRRGERNRVARERGVSREERQPSTLDVVERAGTHRDVVLAVLALDEPYRATLLMRFFEQLPYHEIARRTGVTRATVNSRVTRGLEQLRTRLETSYGGDRRALYLALIPLAKLPTGVVTTLFGVNLMHALIATSAATLLTVAVSVGLSRGTREPAPAFLPVAAGDFDPVGTANDELQLPPAVSGLRTESVPEAAVAPQQERKKREGPAKDAEEDVWKTELFHAQLLAPSVESLAVNTSSGDIDVVESSSGQLEIQAKVRAKLGVVENDRLTQIFEDHVDVREEDGVLTIEDDHRDSRGWNVSFVVHVPGKLPLNANSGSGDVVVRRAKGKVNANTGSGDVKLSLAGERVDSINANTGSGDVVIEVASVESKLSANTGSGDVTALVTDALSPGSAGLNSGSGDIHLIVPANVVGTFDLETNGDDIVLPPSLGIAVKKDVSGRLSARGTLGSGGTYKLRSGSGELRVELGNMLPTKDR